MSSIANGVTELFTRPGDIVNNPGQFFGDLAGAALPFAGPIGGAIGGTLGQLSAPVLAGIAGAAAPSGGYPGAGNPLTGLVAPFGTEDPTAYNASMNLFNLLQSMGTQALTPSISGAQNALTGASGVYDSAPMNALTSMWLNQLGGFGNPTPTMGGVPSTLNQGVANGGLAGANLANLPATTLPSANMTRTPPVNPLTGAPQSNALSTVGGAQVPGPAAPRSTLDSRLAIPSGSPFSIAGTPFGAMLASQVDAINQGKQSALSQFRAQMASQGITDPRALALGESLINQQAAQNAQQATANMQLQGFSGLQGIMQSLANQQLGVGQGLTGIGTSWGNFASPFAHMLSGYHGAAGIPAELYGMSQGAAGTLNKNLATLMGPYSGFGSPFGGKSTGGSTGGTAGSMGGWTPPTGTPANTSYDPGSDSSVYNAGAIANPWGNFGVPYSTPPIAGGQPAQNVGNGSSWGSLPPIGY